MTDRRKKSAEGGQPTSLPFGERAAREVLPQARRADFVTLWRYPAEDHGAFIAEGLGTVTFVEYSKRIADAQATFERQGIRVVIVEATVRDLLDALHDCDLDNTPDGRAAAIGFIAARRSTFTVE